MRVARWLGGAVAAVALIVATVSTCAEGASDPRGDSADAGSERSDPSDVTEGRTDVRPRRHARTATRLASGAVVDMVGAAEDGGGDADEDASPPAIVGRVVLAGEDGVAPHSGVTVRLHRGGIRLVGAAARIQPRDTEFPEVSAEATTGRDGRFRFDVGREEEWSLVLLAPGGAVEAHTGEGAQDLGDVEFSARQEITISVEDEEGSPLAAAEARVFAGDLRPCLRIGADAFGRIRLDSSRDVLVTASDREFAFLDRPRDGELVRLGPAAPLAGHVVDDTGAPLARIVLVLSDDDASLLDVTDETGAFRFERVGLRCGPEGRNLWVHIRKEDSELYQAMPGDEDVRIVVPRSGGIEIEGVVVFEDGRAAAGATVGSTTADAEGKFRLTTSGLGAADRMTLEATVRTAVPGCGVVRTHAGRAEVALRPGGDASGVQVVVRASPYSFFRIDASREDGRPVLGGAWAKAPWFEAGSTDGKTPFAVGVPAGTRFRLHVHAADATVSPTEIDVVTSSDPAAEPYAVRMPGPRACSIRAVDAHGDPLPAGDVKIHVDRNPSTAVGPDGRIVAAAGHHVSVVVVARGLRYQGTVRIPSPPQDVVEIAFPATGTVHGRFVHADGRPAAGIGASIQGSIAGIAAIGSPPSGTDGVFVVSPAPAGRATLHVWRDEGGPEAGQRSIDVPPDGDLDLGDVVVWEDVRLEGRVLGADGAGVGGASVTVTWNAGRGSESVATGPGGQFSLRVPGARDAVVVASRRDSGGTAATAAVEPIDLSAARTATLRLRPVGSIEVRVPRAWEESGWDVSLEPPSGAFSWEPEMEFEDLTTLIHGVPAGRWVVVARAEGVAHRREVVVRAGGTASVEMGP